MWHLNPLDDFFAIKKLYNAPTHPDVLPKLHFSIAGSLIASANLTVMNSRMLFPYLINHYILG